MSARPEKIVMATGNAGKIKELARLLDHLGIALIAQTDLGVGAAAETGKSFVDNSLLKARHAAAETGLPAIADDSGLVVDALSGAPGIYSARYAGAAASDEENVDKLLAELRNKPDSERGAAFHCAATFVMTASSAPLIAEGRWRGSILTTRKGSGGFGYDPVFLDPDSGLSAAELSADEKNARSHRGKALRDLVALIEQRLTEQRS